MVVSTTETCWWLATWNENTLNKVYSLVIYIYIYQFIGRIWIILNLNGNNIIPCIALLPSCNVPIFLTPVYSYTFRCGWALFFWHFNYFHANFSIRCYWRIITHIPLDDVRLVSNVSACVMLQSWCTPTAALVWMLLVTAPAHDT